MVNLYFSFTCKTPRPTVTLPHLQFIGFELEHGIQINPTLNYIITNQIINTAENINDPTMIYL